MHWQCFKLLLPCMQTGITDQWRLMRVRAPRMHPPIKLKRNHQAFRASGCCLTRTRVNNGPCISSESQALVATLLDSSCPGHIHGRESASPTPPSTWQHSPRFHGARTSCSLRRRLGRIRWGSVAKRGNFPRKVQMP